MRIETKVVRTAIYGSLALLIGVSSLAGAVQSSGVVLTEDSIQESASILPTPPPSPYGPSLN